MGVQFDARAKGKKFHGYYWDRLSKKKMSVGMFFTREEAETAVADAVAALNILMEKEKQIVTEYDNRRLEQFAREKDTKKFNQPTFETKPKDATSGRQHAIDVFKKMNYTRETIDHSREKEELPLQKPPPDLKFGLWKAVEKGTKKGGEK
jgi:hypothetical protein